MKQRNSSPSHSNGEQHHIPDIDIIDLDAETMEAEEDSMSPEEFEEAYNRQKPRSNRRENKSRSLLSRINVHIVLLVVTIVFVFGIIYKLNHWARKIDLDEIKNMEDDEEFLALRNADDNILPLLNAKGEPIYMNYGEGTTILAFGNSPFADDRYSEDNLANIIQEMTGATVYNCSVSGSYLTAGWPYLSVGDYPLDVFSFYWLCTIATVDVIDGQYLSAVENLGENAPAEAMEVFNTLKTIDLNTVDVVAIMYDGSDYLAGRRMYNELNPTDIEFFTGNLTAGIELLMENYPNIRFIVMSPTYAYGLDADGNYVSSDVQTYGEDVLSMYSMLMDAQCRNLSITFIDNIYGTITEENASDYLTDHIHLNVQGRIKVAERFVKALQYFNELADSMEQ